jgi:hypothetical protein
MRTGQRTGTMGGGGAARGSVEVGGDQDLPVRLHPCPPGKLERATRAAPVRAVGVRAGTGVDDVGGAAAAVRHLPGPHPA